MPWLRSYISHASVLQPPKWVLCYTAYPGAPSAPHKQSADGWVVLLMLNTAVAMQRYNALSSTQRRIPYTVVRSNSDWVHTPLLNKGSGMWTAAAPVRDSTEGYK